MRSYDLVGMGKLELKEIPKPEIQSGHALVRVAYCAICNQTDMEVYCGERNEQRFLFGHELSGVVEASAPDVDDLAPGDKVLCFNKSEPNSGFSDYILTPITNVYRAPRDMDLRAVALAEMVSVVLKGVTRGLCWGDFVGVFGLGPIGLWYTQLARRLAWKVIGIDPMAERREHAASLGANACFHPDELVEGLKASGLPTAFDVALEGTPANAAIHQALEVLRPDGVLCVTGSHLATATFDMMQFETLTLNLIMTASWPSQKLLDTNATLALRLLDAGILDWQSVLSHVYDLEQLPEALEQIRLRPQEVRKVLVRISEDS